MWPQTLDMNGLMTANTTFYRLFAAGDIDGMGVLWAEVVPVACIHPGWPPIVGRGPVLESFRTVCTPPPPVTFDQAEGYLFGSMGLVVCVEAIEQTQLAASNWFGWDGEMWRMVMHQASPMVPRRPDPDAPQGTVH